MKAFRYITAVAALATLAACNNDEWGDYSTDPNAVRIHATVGDMLTRSNPIDKPTAFSNGDRVAVSTDDNQRVVYAYDGNNWNPEGTDYLTWNQSSYTFKAYYPAGSYTGTENVPADQSSTTADNNIAKADYMKFEGNFSMPSKVTLTMQRQTARVIIDVTKPDWMNQYLDANGAPTHEVKSIRIHSNGVEITPYEKEGKYYALVHPNAKDDNAQFISVTIAPIGSKDDTDNKTLIVRGIPELTAGTSYTYPLIIGKEKAKLGEVTLTDWGNGEGFNGIATDGYTEYTTFSQAKGYAVYTAEGLKKVNEIISSGTANDIKGAEISLYADIVLSQPGDNQANWTPLGYEGAVFGGFNGRGHSITGLVIDSENGSAGLLGECSGYIKDLTLIGCKVKGGGKYVGSLAGFSNATIENCKVIATKDYPVVIEGTEGNVGGLVGENGQQMSKCELICETGGSITITGVYDIGGIAGELTMSDSKISECKVTNKGGTINIGNVNADNVGGIAGENLGQISLCEVNGAIIKGKANVGGLIGVIQSGGRAASSNEIKNTVKNCTITGDANSTGAGFGKKVDDYHIAAITIGTGNTVNGTAVTPSN